MLLYQYVVQTTVVGDVDLLAVRRVVDDVRRPPSARATPPCGRWFPRHWTGPARTPGDTRTSNHRRRREPKPRTGRRTCAKKWSFDLRRACSYVGHEERRPDAVGRTVSQFDFCHFQENENSENMVKMGKWTFFETPAKCQSWLMWGNWWEGEDGQGPSPRPPCAELPIS
jgi:hypothetical protein